MIHRSVNAGFSASESALISYSEQYLTRVITIVKYETARLTNTQQIWRNMKIYMRVLTFFKPLSHMVFWEISMGPSRSLGGHAAAEAPEGYLSVTAILLANQPT